MPPTAPALAPALAAALTLATTAHAQFTGFGPRQDTSLGAGNSPTSSVAADLDNDGDIDLAFPVFQAATFDDVAVTLNNGDGTFAAPTFLGVGGQPADIAAADVDNDGDTDLVTANSESDDISVLRNNGDGTFAPEVFFAVGGNPQGVAVADVNADGNPDIVNTNASDDTVTVTLGDGSGTTWTIDTTYTTNNVGGTNGDNPQAIILTDLNNNGRPDIVTANASSNSLTVLYAIPTSPGDFFSGDFAVFVTTQSNPQDIAAADIDKDGDRDLIIANRTSATVSTRLSDRDAGSTFPIFTGGANIPVPAGPIGIAIADFEDPPTRSDADPDIVVSCELASEVAVLINNGSGAFTVELTRPTLGSPEEPAAADLDGDGDTDLAVPSLFDDAFSVFLNTSTVIGGPPPTVNIDTPAENACLCPGTVAITGTAAPAPGTNFNAYTLTARRLGSSTTTTIASSSTPVSSATLGNWNTASLPAGQYLLKLTASNTGNASASDETVVRLANDTFGTLDAFLAAGLSSAGIGSTNTAGRDACVYGTINDDGCGPITYTVDIAPAGSSSFTPVDPANPTYNGIRINTTLAEFNTADFPDGDYTVRVEASNGCGFTESQNIPLTIDNTAPIAEITSPINCQTRQPGQPLTITGTASDDNLAGWTLQYTGGDTNGWVTIASANTSVTNGTLAVWDTSGLPLCAYTLRLRVSDTAVLNCNTAGNSAGFLASIDLRCESDTNNSGATDLEDLLNVLSTFGQTCP